MVEAAILTCRWPGLRPTPPVETLWVLLTAFLHGEPAPRAGNPGLAWGSRPVAEVYIAPRAVEWLIRKLFGAKQRHQLGVILRTFFKE